METMCREMKDTRRRAVLTRKLRPSRWEAQADAVNMIFSAKTQANPESSVGLMNMAGKGPEVLVTLTTDFGKVLDGMHRTKIKGRTHLATAIQVAGVRCITINFWSWYCRTDRINSWLLNIDKINHSANVSSSSHAHP